MKYNDLIQLYFERTTALQNYWTLYVVIVGGILAFSSLRKQPAALTTLIVTILFGLFAYENLDAIKATATQRHATVAAIKQSDSGSTAPEIKPVRDLLEPTLNPASISSTQTTHLIGDVLTIVGLWVMELRRRKNLAMTALAAQPFP
ncbi:MAG: hypothetical protein DME70_09950 [Verrucomicrobia bacterium]|nr:MAG: hypothetical protein DME70_09950 [Verrucomicrobiota bacterium]